MIGSLQKWVGIKKIRPLSMCEAKIYRISEKLTRKRKRYFAFCGLFFIKLCLSAVV